MALILHILVVALSLRVVPSLPFAIDTNGLPKGVGCRDQWSNCSVESTTPTDTASSDVTRQMFNGTDDHPENSTTSSTKRSVADDACLSEERSLLRSEYRAFLGNQLDLAWRFYWRVRRMNGDAGTYVLSPASISLAFGMMLQAARGTTRQHLVRLLAKDISEDKVGSSYAAFQRDLRLHADYNLSFANAVYLDDSVRLRSEYKSVIEQCYDGAIRQRDFQQTAAVRTEINSWISNQTNSLINDFLPPDFISDSDRLVLVNALYFKGDWMYPFTEGGYDFEGLFKGEVKPENATFMKKTLGDLDYYEDADVTFLGLPYKNNRRMSMYLLLPKETEASASQQGGNNDLSIFEKKILNKMNKQSMSKIFNSYVHKSKRSLVKVVIPKWKLSSPTFLLSDLIVPVAETSTSGGDSATDAIFAESADYSGLCEDGTIRFTDGIHKTVIEVNERGTEAAAATAVGGERSYAFDAQHRFIADRPFIYAITHRETGAILFMGRFGSPPAPEKKQ